MYWWGPSRVYYLFYKSKSEQLIEIFTRTYSPWDKIKYLLGERQLWFQIGRTEHEYAFRRKLPTWTVHQLGVILFVSYFTLKWHFSPPLPHCTLLIKFLALLNVWFYEWPFSPINSYISVVYKFLFAPAWECRNKFAEITTEKNTFLSLPYFNKSQF